MGEKGGGGGGGAVFVFRDWVSCKFGFVDERKETAFRWLCWAHSWS
jgi:hypothetical protein